MLETVVTPGNVHDSLAFDEAYDRVTADFPEVETIVVDFAYKIPHICKKVFKDGPVLSTAYKRAQTMKGGHKWWKNVYDEYYDCVICPEYQVLTYRTTNRKGYWEYKIDPKICAGRPSRHLVHSLQRLCQNSPAAYLEGLTGIVRCCLLCGEVPAVVQTAQRDH